MSDDYEEAYNTLTTLLRKRFPQRADGSLPDYKIEDVLRHAEQVESSWQEMIEARNDRAEQAEAERDRLLAKNIGITSERNAALAEWEQAEARVREFCDTMPAIVLKRDILALLDGEAQPEESKKPYRGRSAEGAGYD